MATMKTKLKDKGAKLIRNLSPEVKIIKEVAGQLLERPQKGPIWELFFPIRSLIKEGYCQEEVRLLVNVCLNEVEKEMKIIERRRKALEKEAKKLAKNSREVKDEDNHQ